VLLENIAKQPANRKSNLFWIIGAFLLSKGAAILKALKALKYAKFAITAITMSISAILYGFAFGSWYFAAGLVLLLLVHEYGHVIAMWKKGIHASAPVFIPFLGAAIFAKIPETKDDEAYIGYGGPLIGTIGALLCIALALVLADGSFWSTLLHILGNVGLFINLFNMIPARPLDGGRILHPLGAGVVYCGFALLAILALVTQDMFFVLIALLSVSNMPVRDWVRNMLWGFMWAVFGFVVLLPQLPIPGIFGTLLVLVFFAFAVGAFMMAWRSRNDPLVVTENTDDTVPAIVKVKWLTLYVVLLAIIGGTMMWHSQHLPKEVRESPLVNFIHGF